MSVLSSRTARVAVASVLQLALVPLAVAGPLSARLTGEEYPLEVAPVDPIDPFRGAYVDLSYPGLQPGRRAARNELPEGEVFVPLVQEGDYWRADGYLSERPEQGPYITCDSTGWSMSCGIESWFTDQDEARRLESLVQGGAVATVKIDDRGNAAIIALDAEQRS